MNHARILCSIVRPALLAATLFPGTLTAGVILEESFESPVVSGYVSNTLPGNNLWIGTNTDAFGAKNRGLYNESVIWPATPPFTTAFGKQGYQLTYSNAALTTASGAFATITQGVTYTVTFRNALPAGSSGGNYTVQLVAFNPGDARNVNNSGTILASTSGTVTTSNMTNGGSIVHTATATHAGKDLAVRLMGITGHSVIYDNIRLVVGHDLNPSPGSGEDLAAGGNVALSWTNLPATAGSTHVDVLFGTSPGALALVVDGQAVNSAMVNAPAAGTYYWRVDSYPDGNPDGTPVTGDVFWFTIADTDGDGLPDEYELAHTNPASNTALDPSSDLDADGLTAAQEYNYNTEPTDADTDNDTLLDGPEIAGAGQRPPTNPRLADTDADGLSDTVETNTGAWVNSSDTGTNPVDADCDDDGLVDGVETNDGNYVGKNATGSNPFDADSDDDNVTDWYEVAASFTSPVNATAKPAIPYPLPDPDSSTGAANKPVKVYIMSGQSNMVGFGTTSGTGTDTLETMIKVQNKFPDLVDGSNNWTTRQDVRYRGVYSDFANAKLSPGALGSTFGPELGFGYVLGWYHDEPVLLLKSCTGNRGVGWDILPPGSPSWEYGGELFAGYGESPDVRAIGSPSTYTPGDWYAGYEWDRYFMDESEWIHSGDAVTNVVDVLDNFATEYPDWAAQGFEIGGFVWWQGDKDRYKMGHATTYETNISKLIDSLRTYYSNRYPGKVVPNAPFVLATLGQTSIGGVNPAADQAIFDAQMAVDGNSGLHPEYAGNVKTVYSYPLSAGGASNSHYNKNAQTYMMVGDALGRAMVDLLESENPPLPNPMTFEIAPAPVNTTTIRMTATAATTINGPVEYYFENTTNGNTSGWTTDRTWTNTGLSNGVTYTYHVKARDNTGLEGDWSAEASATAEADTTAPAPDPMTFASAPAAVTASSITMTATTALDVNGPVQYSFTCTSGGGPNSGWQGSPTYTPVGLSHSTEYTYTVKAKDAIGNETAPSAGASATTPTPDLIAPSVVSYSPAASATEIAADSNLVLTFDEDIAAGTGNISIKNLTDGGQIDIAVTDGSQVSISGAVLTVNPTADLLLGKTYAVQIAASAIDDLVGNSYPGISNDSTWTFTTLQPDLTAPSVINSNPLDNATSVAIDGNLVLTFDEDIAAGSGNLVIKNLTDGNQLTIAVTDGSQVSISGAVLTINPTSALLHEKNYAVQIAGTAIDDLAGNSYAGIADDTTWNFSTQAAPPSGVVVSDDFEPGENPFGGTTPNVTSYTVANTSTQTNSSLWVRATNGFNSSRHGLIDETENGGANFTDPSGTQAYGFRYTNTGITTAFGLIGSLTDGTTIDVSFDVCIDGFNNGAAYEAALVLFDGAGTRFSINGGIELNTAAVLAKKTGNASSGSYQTITFSYTVGENVFDNNGAASGAATAFLETLLGKDIALRFKGVTSSANIDNVEISVTGGGGGVGPLDHFAISAIGSTQTVGTPITGITITAQDASNQTVTDFTGTVSFGGSGGFTGTSGNFVAGVLSNVSVTPANAGSNLTLTVNDGNNHSGSVTIATIQSAFTTWSGGGSFDGDANGDGVQDGLAWLLGASGPSANATGLMPTLDSSSDPNFVIFRNRRSDAAAAHLNSSVRYGSNLTSWTTAVHDGTDIIISVNNDFHGQGIDRVETKIRKSLLVENQLFLQLQTSEK